MSTTQKPLPSAFLAFDSLPDDSYVDKYVVALLFDRTPPTVWRDVELGRVPGPIPTQRGERARWHVGTLRRFIREQAGVTA